MYFLAGENGFFWLFLFPALALFYDWDLATLYCNTFYILGFNTLHRRQLFYFCTIYWNTYSGLLEQAVPGYHTPFFFSFRVAEVGVLNLVGFPKFIDSLAPLRLLVSSSHTFVCTLYG